MKIAFYIIFSVCYGVALFQLFQTWSLFAADRNIYWQIELSTLIFIVVAGTVGLVVHFCAPGAAPVIFYVFFGSLAGTMASQFISNLFDESPFTIQFWAFQYFLLVIVFGLATSGIVVVHLNNNKQITQNMTVHPTPMSSVESS